MATHAPRVRRLFGRGSLGRWAALATLAVVAVLYYRPLTGYLETRDAVSARNAEVVELRREQAELRRRLAAQTSDEALLREARRLGYVQPGETLYIVKGIRAWRLEQQRSRGRQTGRE